MVNKDLINTCHLVWFKPCCFVKELKEGLTVDCCPLGLNNVCTECFTSFPIQLISVFALSWPLIKWLILMKPIVYWLEGNSCSHRPRLNSQQWHYTLYTHPLCLCFFSNLFPYLKKHNYNASLWLKMNSGKNWLNCEIKNSQWGYFIENLVLNAELIEDCTASKKLRNGIQIIVIIQVSYSCHGRLSQSHLKFLMKPIQHSIKHD